MNGAKKQSCLESAQKTPKGPERGKSHMSYIDEFNASRDAYRLREMWKTSSCWLNCGMRVRHLEGSNDQNGNGLVLSRISASAAFPVISRVQKSRPTSFLFSRDFSNFFKFQNVTMPPKKRGRPPKAKQDIDSAPIVIDDDEVPDLKPPPMKKAKAEPEELFKSPVKKQTKDAQVAHTKGLVVPVDDHCELQSKNQDHARSTPLSDEADL